MAKKAALKPPVAEPGASERHPPELVDLPTGELKPNPRNPRSHPEDQLLRLEASLRTDKQTKPVLARRANRMLIAGHGVTEAAKRLGWPTLQVILLDVNQAVADRIMVGDNRHGDLSETDQTKLGELLHEIQEFDWLAAGFTDTETAKLFARLDERDLVVHEIATGDVRDDFWISLRGPMKMQAEALQRVKQLLADMPQVQIQMGITEDVGA